MPNLVFTTVTILEVRYLGRPLQRVFCLLHNADVQWRNFFIALDGKGTTGPETYSGELGKMLGKAHLDAYIADFQSMGSKVPVLPDRVVKNMSKDHRYFYLLVQAVMEGKSFFTRFPNMITKFPGKIHKAR